MSAVNVILKDGLGNDAYPMTVLENVIGLNQKVFDLAYPVGSVFISTTTTSSPAELGISSGTWQRLSGRFLIGSGSNGDGATYTFGNTGGNKDAILVSHSHSVSSRMRNSSAGISRDYGTTGDHICGQTGGTLVWHSSWNDCSSEGQSGADKNMPPYQVVSMWKRVG